MVHACTYIRVFTGESWWESDLLVVAKEYLANVPAADGSGTSLSAAPPLAVREWLVQEQVRSWLVAIFSRADPLRLMEVDLVMQIGKVRTGCCSACLPGTTRRYHVWTASWTFYMCKKQRYVTAESSSFGVLKLLLLLSISFLRVQPLTSCTAVL